MYEISKLNFFHLVIYLANNVHDKVNAWAHKQSILISNFSKGKGQTQKQMYHL